jgi:hypothetical protein
MVRQGRALVCFGATIDKKAQRYCQARKLQDVTSVKALPEWIPATPGYCIMPSARGSTSVSHGQ